MVHINENLRRRSCRRALLTSERFDIDGARYLSGSAAGSVPGNTAWVTREMPPASGFVKYSHRTTSEAALNGDRIFGGMLLQHQR